MTSEWQVAGGSVRGTRHRRADRNNQDGFHWSTDDRLILVVTDGCTSGARSELGALLGARLVARRAMAAAVWPGLDSPESYGRAVRAGLLADLAPVHAALGGTPAELLDHLLFTAVLAVADARHAAVLVMGDGMAAVNGEIRVVESRENRPAYPAYGLLDPSPGPEPRVLWHGPSASVRTLMVGTDGAVDLLCPERSGATGPGQVRTWPADGEGGSNRDPDLRRLTGLLEDDRVFDNPDQLRRLLTVANRDTQRVDWENRRLQRETGVLPDDTTLIVARRI